MELGYSYIREYLTERFDISFASEDAGSAFALPAVFQEGGDVLPKRIYVGKPGMLQSLWEEDVLAICCLKDCENDLEEWRQNANVARRCVFIGLLDVDESLALSCLLDLFNREISWNNSLWHIGVSGEAGAVRSFLDASVELFDDVLLYYPVGEWRSVVYSAPRNKELSAIAGLVDQDGRYSQEVDYHALEDVFEAAAPIVSSMTDRFGKRIKVLAAQIRNNDGTYQGLLVSPIANEIHPQAQHWHMMQLRIALEACLNSAHSSRDGFSASPHSSLQILLSNKKRNIRGAKKQLQMFGFAIRSDYVCIVVDIAGQSEGPGYPRTSIARSSRAWLRAALPWSAGACCASFSIRVKAR